MKIAKFATASIAVVLLALGACGCGPHTVPVSGKIVVDGEPAENIRVVFQSAAGGDQVAPVATGLTDKNGECSLRLAQTNKKGVVPGPYAVFLSWSDPEATDNPIEGETEAAECPYNLPPRANSGELRFEVGDKGESAADFTFDSSEEPANVPVGI